MRAPRLALGLALACPASALLIACGSSEAERYGDAFTDVARPLQAELIDLGNAIGSSNRREPIDAALERASVALETAADGFEELDPPADAEEAQADLLDAIAGFERSIDQAQNALSDGNVREASKAVGDFSAEAQTFATTLGEIGEQLEDAGVPLGEPATTGTP